MEHINKSGSVVNVERLRWINSRHIRSLFDDMNQKESTVEMILPYLKHDIPNINQYQTDYIWKAASLMKVFVSHVTMKSKDHLNRRESVPFLNLAHCVITFLSIQT